jgi:murein DD-endopeptidase MepM/ murein hydrolase activator NlpD
VSHITWSPSPPDDPGISSRKGEDVDRYTLIVVPEGIGQIRRCQVRLAWLTWIACAGLAGVLLIAGGTYDWMRVRREAAEVRALRAEIEQHRTRSAALEAGAMRVQSELERLQEFERRVRVIANLPKRNLEATVDSPPRGGVGGGAESPDAATPPIGVPTGTYSGVPETGTTRPGSAPEASLAPSVSESLRDEKLEQRARFDAASFQDLVAQLEGKAERLASTPSVWPTRGWVTSQFGWRISPFTGKRDLHEGIDIAGDFGTPIAAPARASVVFAGPKGPLGNTLILDHGNGVRTTYGHLREALARDGDRIERGQIIGTIGSSGRSTGPHLHYAIEVRGRLVNPLDYVVE